MHRKHEIANKETRRLRKRETKLGESLTVTKTRRKGGLFSRWTSAMFSRRELCDGRLWDLVGGLGEDRGEYLKGQTCGARIARVNRARCVRLELVSYPDTR